MRQVITLGAHIMNQNDQFIIFGSIINKQNRFSENRTFPTCYRQNRRAQQKHLSGIKKKETPFFFTVQKLAQYSLTSVAMFSRLVVVRKPQIHRPTSRKPWEWEREREERQKDRQREQQRHRNRNVTVITHPVSRGFDGQMWNSSDNPHRNHRLWCIMLVLNEP